MNKPPNYTAEDWERIGATPGGGNLSRLRIHNGWLVRETFGYQHVAMTFVPFTPTRLPCVGEWNCVKREVEDELPSPAVTTVTTPGTETVDGDAQVLEQPTEVEVKTEA